MIGYKLTNQNMQTYNNTQWQISKWKKTDGNSGLCGPGWLHYYSDPLLAVLLNPIHAGFRNPRLFEAEISGETKEDHGLKFGCTKMRLVKELQMPVVSAEQRVKFAIYCALEVCESSAFVTWANNWLDGTDRTKKTAKAVLTIVFSNAAEAAINSALTTNPIDVADAAFYASFSGHINLISLAEKAVK